LALKLLAIAAASRLLTSSLTVGTLIRVVLGHVWNLLFPGVPVAAFAIMSTAVILAWAMHMSLTAIALTIGLTCVGYDFWVPMFLAVASSSAALLACAGSKNPGRRCLNRNADKRRCCWLSGGRRYNDFATNLHAQPIQRTIGRSALGEFDDQDYL
jgi:hypothetical protein